MNRRDKSRSQPVSAVRRAFWGISLTALVGGLGLLVTQQSAAADIVVAAGRLITS